MSTFPHYYTLLNIPKTATQDEIRQVCASPGRPRRRQRLIRVQAYKRESLRCHPDRLGGNATPAETKRATERFQVRVYAHVAYACLTFVRVHVQAVADAYYVLSDPIVCHLSTRLRSAITYA